VQLGKNGKTITGIIGLGAASDAIEKQLAAQGYTPRTFDPRRGIGTAESINEADIVFICAPAPYRESTGFDSSALEEAVSLLEGSKVIVIRTTVLPGTTEAYQFRYTQHCFLFNPAFLTQASAGETPQPDRQIIGYTAQSRHLAESVLSFLPAAPYTRLMPAREAELAKYMTNAFLAMKVTFANELFDLATALDIDYNTVREAVAADARIGDSHLDVLADGYRGYGGESLPRDTKALLELSERMSVPLRLLRTADRVNDSLLPPSDETVPRALRLIQDVPPPERDDRAA
jgi:UDPglucose 6-dehydrogenase